MHAIIRFPYAGRNIFHCKKNKTRIYGCSSRVGVGRGIENKAGYTSNLARSTMCEVWGYCCREAPVILTRPDTRLPQLRADGQGLKNCRMLPQVNQTGENRNKANTYKSRAGHYLKWLKLTLNDSKWLKGLKWLKWLNWPDWLRWPNITYYDFEWLRMT